MEQSDLIVTNGGFAAVYFKRAGEPQLILRRRSPTDDHVLLARALQAANQKDARVGLDRVKWRSSEEWSYQGYIPMSKSSLQVGFDNGLIIVVDPATRYYAIYSRASDRPELLAHGHIQQLQLLRRRPTKDRALLAAAYRAANAKAREAGVDCVDKQKPRR